MDVHCPEVFKQIFSMKNKLSEYPKEVIQRWIRLKISKKIKYFVLVFMRPFLLYKHQKNRQVLDKTFDVIKDQAIKLERTNYTSSKIIFNIALYFLLAQKDIQAVKIDALTHPNPWKRNLSLRIMLLTVYEWDMDKVAGKNIRNALDEIGASEELKTKTYQSFRLIRNAQKKAKKNFSFLRNATIAHRDSDALLQYRSIRNLDEKVVLQLCVEFYKGVDMFIDLVPLLMTESGSLQGLWKQLTNHNARTSS